MKDLSFSMCSMFELQFNALQFSVKFELLHANKSSLLCWSLRIWVCNHYCTFIIEHNDMCTRETKPRNENQNCKLFDLLLQIVVTELNFKSYKIYMPFEKGLISVQFICQLSIYPSVHNQLDERFSGNQLYLNKQRTYFLLLLISYSFLSLPFRTRFLKINPYSFFILKVKIVDSGLTLTPPMFF